MFVGGVSRMHLSSQFYEEFRSKLGKKFERAYEWLEKDVRCERLGVREDSIFAIVRGEHGRYAVTMDLEDDEWKVYCSCMAGRRGYLCSHIIYLGLYALKCGVINENELKEILVPTRGWKYEG